MNGVASKAVQHNDTHVPFCVPNTGALPLGVFTSQVRVGNTPQGDCSRVDRSHNIQTQDSVGRKAADFGLAVGIPLHSHIALNYVLTDYLPKASQGMPYLQTHMHAHANATTGKIAPVSRVHMMPLLCSHNAPLVHSYLGAARWGVLGLSAVTCAGLLRLNMAGPGVTQTVKDLWKS